jgi:hypothetical protein
MNEKKEFQKTLYWSAALASVFIIYLLIFHDGNLWSFFELFDKQKIPTGQTMGGP